MSDNAAGKKAGGSKFSGLLAAVREREAEGGAEALDAGVHDVPVHQPAVAASITKAQGDAEHPSPAKAPPKRGRPPGATGGKRSDAEFGQVTAYIRRRTHKQVKSLLLDEGREFSKLVEELLTDWLEKRAKD